jgi:hypothetical protein
MFLTTGVPQPKQDTSKPLPTAALRERLLEANLKRELNGTALHLPTGEDKGAMLRPAAWHLGRLSALGRL